MKARGGPDLRRCLDAPINKEAELKRLNLVHDIESHVDRCACHCPSVGPRPQSLLDRMHVPSLSLRVAVVRPTEEVVVQVVLRSNAFLLLRLVVLIAIILGWLSVRMW